MNVWTCSIFTPDIQDISMMKIKEIIRTAFEIIIYTRSVYLLVYMNAFEVFRPLGLLGCALIYFNIRTRIVKLNLNNLASVTDDNAQTHYDLFKKKEIIASQVENIVSTLVFLISYCYEPITPSVEFGRLQCVLQMSTEKSLFRKDIIPYAKLAIDSIIQYFN